MSKERMNFIKAEEDVNQALEDLAVISETTPGIEKSSIKTQNHEDLVDLYTRHWRRTEEKLRKLIESGHEDAIALQMKHEILDKKMHDDLAEIDRAGGIENVSDDERKRLEENIKNSLLEIENFEQKELGRI